MSYVFQHGGHLSKQGAITRDLLSLRRHALSVPLTTML